MHLIGYISKAKQKSYHGVPNGFFKLLKKSRASNINNGITGVISYSNGYYFQIIEGEMSITDGNIAQSLFNKISKDDRHHSISQLFNFSTPRRYFENNPLKVFLSNHQDEMIQNFLNDNIDRVFDLPDSDKSILSHFLDIPEIENIEPTKAIDKAHLEDYSLCSFKLLSWPNFIELDINPCPEILYVCNMMIYDFITYEDILYQLSMDNIKLDNFLTVLDTNGLIVKSPRALKNLDNIESNPQKRLYRYGDFFKKMKSYLSKNNGLNNDL